MRCLAKESREEQAHLAGAAAKNASPRIGTTTEIHVINQQHRARCNDPVYTNADSLEQC